jgi:hypothetical protein
MPSVILKNCNGSLKIVSKDVILETPNSNNSNYTSDISNCNGTTFKQNVQNDVCFFTQGSQDISGVQWIEYGAVPLYSDIDCTNILGLAYFKDESIGIGYGIANNCQMVIETGTFVINTGAFNDNTNHSTSIQYSLAQAGKSVYFQTGNTYKLKLTSSFDTNPSIDIPLFNTMTIDVGLKLRTLILQNVFGNFNNIVNGVVKYYWTTDDFAKSNDYGYANNSMNYLASV